MIDLDRYVCPGPNCLKTLEEHLHPSKDADPLDTPGIQLWPDGGWVMCCASCDWQMEGGPETRHPDAVPPTLRRQLPPDVVRALESYNGKVRREGMCGGAGGAG